MVFGGNGLIVILPILLAFFTLAWCVLGSRDKVKVIVCSVNIILVGLVFFQIFFKIFPITGEPLVISLLVLSFSMLISPIGIIIHGKLKNT